MISTDKIARAQVSDHAKEVVGQLITNAREILPIRKPAELELRPEATGNDLGEDRREISASAEAC